MHEGRKFSAEGVGRGIQHAQGGLEIAGDNALLYASLGFLYWGAYDFGARYQDETLDLAEKYASKALELLFVGGKASPLSLSSKVFSWQPPRLETF